MLAKRKMLAASWAEGCMARKMHLLIWRDGARRAGRRGNAEVRFFQRRRWRFAARLAGKCAHIAKFHHTIYPASSILHPYWQNPSTRVCVLVLFARKACAKLAAPRPHRLLAPRAGLYRQSCGKVSRSGCILTELLSSCGRPRRSFELLRITACLSKFLNSVSVVENYMERSIISEAVLAIKGHSESERYSASRIENLSLTEGYPLPPVPWRQSIDARDSGGTKSPFKRSAKLPVRDGIARSP
jgi:hypothetical protein